MSKDKEIILYNELKENEDFFRKYLEYLRKRKYGFSKQPEDLIFHFEALSTSVVASNALSGFAFASTFIYFFNYIFSEAKYEKQQTFLLKPLPYLFHQDKNWVLVNHSLNDLYNVNKDLGRISFLKLFLHHSTDEISEIIGIPEVNVLRELEFSKAFMIGWIVRDKNLDKTIFPLLEERQLVEFFEYDNSYEEINNLGDDSEYIKDLERVSLEIDNEVANLKQINSNLLKMTEVINSKLDHKK